MFGTSLNPFSDTEFLSPKNFHTSIGAFGNQAANAPSGFDPSLIAMMQNTLIQFNAQSGVVSINGTSNNDIGLVTNLSNGQIRVQLVGVESRIFDASGVTRIDFFGRQGDDVFNNTTSIDSIGYGHSGNDRLRGRGGNDRYYGGPGADRLEGLGGNDLLAGNQDDDVIYGGVGDDSAFGGTGNDWIFGENGSDFLSGDDGNDTIDGGSRSDEIRGGNGNDSLIGSSGNDRLDGDSGNDLIYGDAGNDLIYGGNDHDRVFAGDGHDRIYLGSGNDYAEGQAGNDRIYGGSGRDEIVGNAGNDSLFGEADDDTLKGGTGVDTLDGGTGNDTLYGQQGSDKLYGNNGNDLIFGGDGNDRAYGNSGDDSIYGGRGLDILYGENGNDNLYGGADRDVINGGNGNDGLFGGSLGHIDLLTGGSGTDRFLLQRDDRAIDRGNGDAAMRFNNRGSKWTDLEIETLDIAFFELHMRTGNVALLKDKLTGDDLQFVKVNSLGGDAAAQNVLTTYSRTTTNPRTGQSVTTYRYEREIQVANWNEKDQPRNDVQPQLIIHEMGHNWDSKLELNAQLGNAGYLWNKFLARSGWRKNKPNNNYVRSTDGQWWYLKNSEFSRPIGRFNPYEDWSTVWEEYFKIGGPQNAPSGNLRSKLFVVNRLFELAE